MAENSKIEWTDHTFNPWIGCTKVSPACDHCYAETQNDFRKWNAAGLGPQAPRKRTSEANWRKPLQWDKQAAADGVRRRVFCASLSDVFDNHKSIQPEWRADLWELIGKTPNLDWLLLTKRPQNIARYLPNDSKAPWYRPWRDLWPWDNVWLGTTVENQEEADRRIPHLLSVPAQVHFLSCEPLLGPVDLTQVNRGTTVRGGFSALAAETIEIGEETYSLPGLDWVICGGESGPNARPMHPDWARSLRDQCKAAGVAFHFKQWGEWYTQEIHEKGRVSIPMQEFVLKIERWHRWDGNNLRKLDLYEAADESLAKGFIAAPVGKKAAGRLLDGVEHNGLPEVRP